MANSVVIKGPVVDDWTKAFNKIADSLKKLESVLDKSGDQVAVFDSKFTNTRNFKEFLKLIKELDAVTVSNFGVISKGISQLTRSLSTFLKLDLSGFDTIAPKIRRLIAAFQTGSSGGATGATPGSSVFVLLRSIAKAIDPEDLKSINKFLSVGARVGDVIKTLTSLTSSLSDVDLKSKNIVGLTKEFGAIQPVFKLLRHIVQQISKLGDLKFDPKSIENVLSIIKLFSGGPGKGGKISFAPIINLVKSLSELSKDMPDFRGEVLLNKLRPFAKLDPIFNLIEHIVNRIGRISIKAEQGAGVDRISKLVSTLPKITAVVPQLLKTVRSIPQFRGTVLLNRLRPFAKLDPVFRLISRIATQTSKIANKVQKTQGISNLSKLITAIDKIAGALPKILDLGRVLKPNLLPSVGALKNSLKRMLQIRTFFGVLGLVLKPLSKLAGQTKNTDKIQLVTKAMLDMVKLAEVTKGLEFQKPKGFAAFVKEMVEALNPLKGLNVDKGKVDQLKSAYNSLGSSGGSAKGLGKVQSRVAGIGKTIRDQVIRRIIDNIVDASLQAIGRLKEGIVNFKDTIGRAFTSLARTMSTAGDRLINSGQQLLRNFSLLSIKDAKGTGLALDFDDLSKQMTVFAKNIPLEEAQAFSNEIGIKYPQSANEALQSILNLSKAGQEFASIQNILPSAADLSAISESGDLDKMTKFLISAEASFRNFSTTVEGTFANSEVAANAVFRAANVSTASVDSLVEALVIAAPTANRFNLALDESAAFLTLFEDAGIRGTQAGNLFSTVLNEIAKPKARKELDRLGVAWQNQDGSLRAASQILDDVQKKYAELNLTQVETGESLRELGGDKFGQQGLSIIFGRGGIEEVLESMGDLEDASNSAGSAASTLLESLKGQTQQLGGSFDTLLTKVFLPLLDRFFLPLVKIARIVVDSLLTLPDSIIGIISTGIGLAATFATIAGAALILVGVLSQLAAGFLFLVGGLIVMTGIIPQLILGLAAMSASLLIMLPIILLLAGAFITLSAVVNRVFEEMDDATSPVAIAIARLKGVFENTFKSIERIANVALLAFKEVFGSIFNQGTEDQINSVAKAIDSVSGFLSKFSKTLDGIDTESLVKFFINLRTALVPVLAAVSTISGGIFQTIFGDPGGVAQIEAGASSLRW